MQYAFSIQFQQSYLKRKARTDIARTVIPPCCRLALSPLYGTALQYTWMTPLVSLTNRSEIPSAIPHPSIFPHTCCTRACPEMPCCSKCDANCSSGPGETAARAAHAVRISVLRIGILSSIFFYMLENPALSFWRRRMCTVVKGLLHTRSQCYVNRSVHRFRKAVGAFPSIDL